MSTPAASDVIRVTVVPAMMAFASTPTLWHQGFALHEGTEAWIRPAPGESGPLVSDLDGLERAISLGYDFGWTLESARVSKDRSLLEFEQGFVMRPRLFRSHRSRGRPICSGSASFALGLTRSIFLPELVAAGLSFEFLTGGVSFRGATNLKRWSASPIEQLGNSDGSERTAAGSRPSRNRTVRELYEAMPATRRAARTSESP